jgi:hypothetical protein
MVDDDKININIDDREMNHRSHSLDDSYKSSKYGSSLKDSESNYTF